MKTSLLATSLRSRALSKSLAASGMLSLCLLCILILAACGNSASHTQASVPVHPTMGIRPSQTYKLGLPAQIAHQWQITVDHIHSSEGLKRSHPRQGYKYILLNVRLNNLASHAQEVSSLLQFSLQAPDGQAYPAFIGNESEAINGSLNAGDSQQGVFAYEVPQNMYHFVFSFIADTRTNREQGLWNIAI